MASEKSRVARMRRRLASASDARVDEIESYLAACGWRRRTGKGAHRAWVKAGKRTLIIPVHGRRVREYVIRQVLEATQDEQNETR